MNSAVSSEALPATAGTAEAPPDVAALMQQMGRAAVAAAAELANASSEIKQRALATGVAALRANAAAILASNAEDTEEARRQALGTALLDRLRLDPMRIEAMARGLEELISLPDPIGTVSAEWERPNGLRIARV